MNLIKINLKEKKNGEEEIQKAQIQILKPKNFDEFLIVLKTQFDNASSKDLKIFCKNQKGENIEIKDDNTFSKENYSEFTVFQYTSTKNANYNVEKIYEELNNEYYLDSFIEKEEVINKINELRGNKAALREWIFSLL